MKNLFKSLSLATLLATATASAQPVGTFGLFTSLPVVANTTNSYAPFVNIPYGNGFLGCGEFLNVGFSMSATTGFPTNCIGNIIVRLARSSDGLTCETTPSVVLSCPLNSTNAPQIISVVSTAGTSGLFLASVEAGGITNSLGTPISGVTNLVTLKFTRLAPKVGAYEATPF